MGVVRERQAQPDFLDLRDRIAILAANVEAVVPEFYVGNVSAGRRANSGGIVIVIMVIMVITVITVITVIIVVIVIAVTYVIAAIAVIVVATTIPLHTTLTCET